MTDTSKHLENGVYNRGWIPQRWEHKDRWCEGLSDDLFLFANVNNNNLLEGQKFNFTFKIVKVKKYTIITPTIQYLKLSLKNLKNHTS